MESVRLARDAKASRVELRNITVICEAPKSKHIARAMRARTLNCWAFRCRLSASSDDHGRARLHRRTRRELAPQRPSRAGALGACALKSHAMFPARPENLAMPDPRRCRTGTPEDMHPLKAAAGGLLARRSPNIPRFVPPSNAFRQPKRNRAKEEMLGIAGECNRRLMVPCQSRLRA